MNQKHKTGIFIISFLFRFTFFTIGWFILIGELYLGDFWFAFLILIATTWISLYSLPPGVWVLRPIGFLRFFAYFLVTAVRGGLDVAKRAFSKSVPTDTDFIVIRHDPDPMKTLILAWVISMLPGTASCEIEKKSIVIHVLDKKLPVEEETKKLQALIDGMFREKRKKSI